MASRQEGRGLGVAGMPAVLLPRGSLLEVLRVGSKGVPWRLPVGAHCKLAAS